MTQSVAVEFAKFLRDKEYGTRMWERGYTQDDANGVCHALSEWVRDVVKMDGEFVMVWGQRDGTRFSGDSELTYLAGGQGYLLPNPFIEGAAEEFVGALQHIVQGRTDQLFATSVGGRILYNATA